MSSNRLISIVLLILITGLSQGCEPESSSASNEGNSASSGPDSSEAGLSTGMTTPGMTNPMMNTPFIYPGVLSPQTYGVDQVSIPDDAAVIGIEEGDESKAFLCKAMSLMTTHVINDLIGTRPVSVTYCDRTDCARVLSGTDEGVPPGLELGGYHAGEMMLRVNKVMYPQTSKSIPLKDRVFEKTTWGQWKEEHPSTVIYIGNRTTEFLIKDEDKPQ